MSDLVGNPEDRFSRVEAQFMDEVFKADSSKSFGYSFESAYHKT